MRKRFAIPLWFIGFLLAVVVGLYAWVTQSSWLKNQIESQINRALGTKSDVTLSVGATSGNIFSGVALTDLLLTIKRGSQIDTLVLASRILVRYDPRGLFSKSRRIRAIEIERLQVFVPRDSIETIFHKAEQKISAEAELEGSLNLTIDSISIRDGIVYRQDEPKPLADSVGIRGSFRSSDGQWALAVAPSAALTTWVGLVQFEGLAASAGDSWRCDSLSARTKNSSVVISGALDTLQIHTAHLDLGELSQSTDLGLDGVLDISGDISADLDQMTAVGGLQVAGTLAGFELADLQMRFSADSSSVSFDSLAGVVSGSRFRGQGRFNWSVKPERWEYRGQVAGFDLNRFVEGAIQTSLSGRVEITGTGVTGSDLRIRSKVELGPGEIDSIRFDSMVGSLGATADSLLIGEEFTVSVNGARLVGGGTMAFADSVDLFVSFESRDLRPFDQMVFIDSLAGRMKGHAYLTGLTEDPDLAAFVSSDSLRLFDLRTSEFEADVSIPHFLSNPSGQVDARWGESSTWGILTDSIELHATLLGRQIEIGWARWYSPQVDIEGSGTLNWSADTIPLNLFPLTLRWENQTYSASDNVLMSIDSAGFVFHQFQFEGPLGIFHATGRMGFDNTMALDFELDRFHIAKVWERFFPTWDVDGVIAARGQLRGTFNAPEIALAGDISEFEFEGESYGELKGGISYRDRILEIEWAELDNRYFHASASGTFPIDLSFDSIGSRVLNTQPLTGRLEASGDNLDPINRFLPQTIESVRGNFALQAGVTGTPQSPRFFGEATLTQGTIKTIEIANPLEDVVVDLALRHDTVVIRNASAVVRDKNLAGNVDVKGTMRIRSIKSFDYDLQVTGRGVPARMEFKDFFVLADFDLSVFGTTPPKVVGTVRPKRVEDREPFTESVETPVYDANLWDWDIAIEMPSGGYSIRNDQLEAELSADLRLGRERGQPSYIGTAEFIRGKVYLFDKVGRIKRGVLTFDDPLKADPRLDIDVGFRIQQPRVVTRTETSSSPFVDLNLHIGGRASEPLIQPEAPYSEQDVLLLLAANTTGASSDSSLVSDPFANRLKFAATGLVFSEVQRSAARKLGLETLEISAGENPFDASITVGRYFSSLYLYGTSPIDAGVGQEVGFEYRLSRRIFFEGHRDKSNLYRLNIHFNWEY